MTQNKTFDVIIIGGSYAGLSAGMALGRAIRNILIIDSGKPCNIQTPHSHNFLTQDGQTPKNISSLARQQVVKYDTVQFYNGVATRGSKANNGFEITTESGDKFSAKKLIFATGIKDLMPDIKGFAECWGITAIHCPYCHGYEVRNEKTGILGNGDLAFEFAKLIDHWTKDLTVFTNGKSTLTLEQTEKLRHHKIGIVETEIDAFEHKDGRIKNSVFKNGTTTPLTAIYTKLPFVQHCDVPQQLGCETNEQGLIKIDPFQKTTIPGVFACGDNTTAMRSVSNAVAQGTFSGAVVNREIIEEEF